MDRHDKSESAPAKRHQEHSSRCPICNSPEFLRFFVIDALPVSDGILYRDADSSRAAPKGAIALACCHRCGYIGNERCEKFDLICSPEYEISLHHSPRYRKFLEDSCHTLIERYAIRDSVVMEIGCGKGFFVELICRLGNNTGYGFDPVVPKHSAIAIGNNHVYLSPEDYTLHCKSVRPALVCCRHVLQQILDPVGFISEIHNHTKLNPPTIVYLEVPNAVSIFRSENVWSILYEYHSYFSELSLSWLFRSCGFKVLNVQSCYADDQYVEIEASPSISKDDNTEPPLPTALVAQVAEFADTYRSKVKHWQSRLAEMSSAGKRVVAWGSGGRAICFFNALEIDEQIAYVVDINPDRQGYFLPSTAQKIVAPEFLKSYRPDVIIVTNPAYESEIREMAKGMGIECETLSI